MASRRIFPATIVTAQMWNLVIKLKTHFRACGPVSDAGQHQWHCWWNGRTNKAGSQHCDMLLFFWKVIHYVNVRRTGGNYDFRGVNSALMGNYQLPLHVLGLSLTVPSCLPSCLSVDTQKSVIIQLRCLQTPTDPTWLKVHLNAAEKLRIGGLNARCPWCSGRLRCLRLRGPGGALW